MGQRRGSHAQAQVAAQACAAVPVGTLLSVIKIRRVGDDHVIVFCHLGQGVAWQPMRCHGGRLHVGGGITQRFQVDVVERQDGLVPERANRCNTACT